MFPKKIKKGTLFETTKKLAPLEFPTSKIANLEFPTKKISETPNPFNPAQQIAEGALRTKQYRGISKKNLKEAKKRRSKLDPILNAQTKPFKKIRKAK